MNKTLYVNLAASHMTAEGFDFLACLHLQPELYFSGSAIDRLSPEDLSNLRDMISSRGFRPIMHAPFFDLNPGSRDPRIQDLFRTRMLWTLETAKAFQATQIVVHPGYGPWVLVRNFDTWFQRAQPLLAEVITQAAHLGVRLAFENIYDADPQDLKALLDHFPDHHVGICLDVGHFNLFSESGLKTWLEIFGKRLFEVHLHDNFGTEDNHIAVGDGTVKYGQLISWLKTGNVDPYLTLEMPQETHVIKSVNRIRSWFTEG